jgi:hypothetical protein
MLNENKVKMMTKMAINEKNEGRNMLRTARFFKSDYVSLGVLGTIIRATVAFLLVILMIALCNMQWLTNHVNDIDLLSMGSGFIVWYIGCIAVFGLIGGLVYAHRYDVSRNELKRYFSRLGKLERYYGAKGRKSRNR